MPEQFEASNTPLGSFKISSANLNTIFTVLGFVITCIIAWVLFSHNTEAKDSGKDVARELKEANREVAQTLKDSNKEISKVLGDLARALREQNCLNAFPTEKRHENAELCKRISQ